MASWRASEYCSSRSKLNENLGNLLDFHLLTAERDMHASIVFISRPVILYTPQFMPPSLTKYTVFHHPQHQDCIL